MRIAIIGSGISGLTVAHYLNKEHEVVIFEKDSWIGGHAHTVYVNDLAIDTGFIVFNNKNYPNFKKILDGLNVEYHATEMSFSVSNPQLNLEYKGKGLDGLFADKFNLFRPKFYQLIFDIIKFNRLAKQKKYASHETVGDFVTRNNFGKYFIEGYLCPMGSAIWSMGIKDMYSFPIDFLVTFFNNHGLLNLTNRPQWYTIKGGSAEYVKKIITPFKNKIRINTSVVSVTRNATNVLLRYKNNNNEIFDETFDKIVFACHAPEALKILNTDVTDSEQVILSNILTSKNEVILHHDTTLLPTHKNAFASWNYLIDNNSNNKATVTYNMNILQKISDHAGKHSKTYCITLNNSAKISAEKIIAQYTYYHPIYSVKSMIARNRWNDISGINNTYFCGAYWHNGFHEDGVVSALKVCRQIGLKI